MTEKELILKYHWRGKGMYKLQEIKLKQGYPNRFRTRQWIKALEKRFRKESKELVENIRAGQLKHI